MTDIISDLLGAIGGSAGAITSFIQVHGYLALVLLMTIEGISFPVPSEVIAPAAGYFAAEGILSFWPAFFAILIGNTIGMIIAYAIGFYLGKDVIYRHLQIFRIKKETLDAFDAWFQRNGPFAVFVSRMLPEIRALMSYPAGFAQMRFKKFLFWSVLGSAIWDLALMLFGYYLISTQNFTILSVSVAAFLIVMYLLVKVAVGRIKKPAAAAK